MTYSTDPGHKSPEEIERELDEERGRLARTADELQSRFSVGSLIDEVMHRTQDHGGDFARNFGRTVRDNPVPVALIGVGLAWLMAGGQDATDRRRGAFGRFRRADGPEDELYEDDWPDEGGYGTMSAYGGPRTQHLGRGEPGGGIPRSGVDWDEDESSPSLGERVGEGARSARDGVSGAAGSAASSVSGAASSAASGVSGAAASARDGVAGAASRAGDAARRAGASVGEGARSAGRSISRAGDAAYWRARYYGQRAGRSLDDMIEEQPLVVGALALALGAAIGGLLPNTRAENRLMGRQAERLRRDAGEAVAEEGRKARQVAERAADEAGRVVDEAAGKADRQTPDGRSMVDRTEERLREAAGRVSGAAEDEARRQDLGSSVDPRRD